MPGKNRLRRQCMERCELMLVAHFMLQSWALVGCLSSWYKQSFVTGKAKDSAQCWLLTMLYVMFGTMKQHLG
jgi:hypothetical protein